MKYAFFLIQAFLVMLTVALLCIPSGCKDPEEFQPIFDSLIPPPEAPQLLSPPSDTVIWYDVWNQYPNDEELRWEPVDGAQYYEIHISTNPDFPENPDQVSSNSYVYTVQNNGLYYWRVRAYARNWEWYTAWSEVWNFRCAYSP